MRITLRILAATCLTATTFHSFAATDGTVGSSDSSGNFDITLTVPPQIIVKNFDDMDLNTDGATLGNTIEGTEDICVGGIGFGNYSVGLSSLNGSTGGPGSDPFQLNGTAQNLPYSAAFVDDTSSTSGTAADTNGDISGSFARASNLNCNTDNARVFVTIDAADWASANETSYSDTLTVTVTAQ